ncbi:MAG: RNA 2',3'-cyclic phosphodiesterase [Anaerolineales bacterium]|nr:RNA 2',3'-cyclic phosphodiesterase [Anaerolineales bacterium]
MATIRTFIALPLPDPAREILVSGQHALQPLLPADSVRWLRPAQMHLTLVFLGDTPLAQLSAIGTLLDAAAAAQKRFTLAIARPGCFPNCRRPRVLWAGLGGDVAACQALKTALDQGLAPLGWEPEKRPYSPHLTLGRARQNSRLPALDPAAVQLPAISWEVDLLHLYESKLGPAGPRYTIRHTARLAS